MRCYHSNDTVKQQLDQSQKWGYNSNDTVKQQLDQSQKWDVTIQMILLNSSLTNPRNEMLQFKWNCWTAVLQAPDQFLFRKKKLFIVRLKRSVIFSPDTRSSLNRFIRTEYYMNPIFIKHIPRKNNAHYDSCGSHRERSSDCDLHLLTSPDLDYLLLVSTSKQRPVDVAWDPVHDGGSDQIRIIRLLFCFRSQ